MLQIVPLQRANFVPPVTQIMNVRMGTTLSSMGLQLVPQLHILRSLILTKPILQAVLQIRSVIMINVLNARIVMMLLVLQLLVKPQFVFQPPIGQM